MVTTCAVNLKANLPLEILVVEYVHMVRTGRERIGQCDDPVGSNATWKQECLHTYRSYQIGCRTDCMHASSTCCKEIKKAGRACHTGKHLDLCFLMYACLVGAPVWLAHTHAWLAHMSGHLQRQLHRQQLQLFLLNHIHANDRTCFLLSDPDSAVR